MKRKDRTELSKSWKGASMERKKNRRKIETAATIAELLRKAFSDLGITWAEYEKTEVSIQWGEDNGDGIIFADGRSGRETNGIGWQRWVDSCDREAYRQEGGEGYVEGEAYGKMPHNVRGRGEFPDRRFSASGRRRK